MASSASSRSTPSGSIARRRPKWCRRAQAPPSTSSKSRRPDRRSLSVPSRDVTSRQIHFLPGDIFMRHRTFGRTAFTTTDIGFGAWQIGGAWGDVSEADGRSALNAALDAGMTFIDTADVYGDGRSEKIIADVLKARGGTRPMVATKAGRRLSPHIADGYTKANLEGFIDRSR